MIAVEPGRHLRYIVLTRRRHFEDDYAAILLLLLFSCLLHCEYATLVIGYAAFQ